MKFDVLVDLQFGSTGKGALAGFLGVRNNYDAVISCNRPNAGHTAYAPDTGDKFIHKVLPSAIFGEGLEVVGIGHGAAFFLDRLEQEWKDLCEYRQDLTLVIHDAAVVATEEHKITEQATLGRIASTMQGSAEAVIAKLRRDPRATVRGNEFQVTQRLQKYGKVKIVDQAGWLKTFRYRELTLLEGSQGYSLGISAGFYPYCTSRNCGVAQVIDDCSLPHNWLIDVYGSARVHPIRVGNTPEGTSGDWYPDQKETTFEELAVEPERTTVTQRIRRVASFSARQIREAMEMAHPTAVFLNFYQYEPRESVEVRQQINDIAVSLGCGGVKFIGTGPLPSDIEEV